jgi:hypothetical protein
MGNMTVEYKGIWEGYNRPPGDEREMLYRAYIFMPEDVFDQVVCPFDGDFFAVDQVAKQYDAQHNGSQVVTVEVVTRQHLESIRQYFESEGSIKPVLEERKTREVVVYAPQRGPFGAAVAV